MNNDPPDEQSNDLLLRLDWQRGVQTGPDLG
jgi:hypothetical protein